MLTRLTTAPGRIDIYVRDERFTSYLTDLPNPGFGRLHANGMRPVTQSASDAEPTVSFGRQAALSAPTGSIETSSVRTIDLVARRGSQSVGFQHQCARLGADGEIELVEQRTVRVLAGPSAGILLDIAIDLAAVVPDVKPTKDRHGLIGLRAANTLFPAGGGQMIDSENRFGPEEIDGQYARWCSCMGVVLGETVGLAILDHPDNPGRPAMWRCDSTCQLSPIPVDGLARRLNPGERLRLRYRIVVHSGFVEALWVNERFREWITDRTSVI